MHVLSHTAAQALRRAAAALQRIRAARILWYPESEWSWTVRRAVRRDVLGEQAGRARLELELEQNR